MSQPVEIPDLSNLMLVDATAQLEDLGLAITIVEGVEGEEARVQGNGPADPPGTMVESGHSVGVILFPPEPRQ